MSIQIFSNPARRTFCASLITLLILLATGCAGVQRQDKATDAAGAGYGVDGAEFFEEADGVWECPELAAAFRSYWLDLFQNRIDEAWNHEAPYFRYLVRPGVYRSFRGGVSRNTLHRIVVSGVDEMAPRLKRVRGHIVLESGGTVRTVPLQDEWVFAGGRWYHVLRDAQFFPFTKRPEGL